ncbi:glutamate receptor 2.7-like isoform X1 [Zingiber officinale]|uniref:Glutamate receptor n=1 Tax=Zingiber officinale TaxID=94328 RepID=A0A8J5G6V7_ZINOF|nr:glutamate receptor 2.7-like isoform X1 [Zingiber officinale]KAG6501051.1 hypothetical protein ZIOFF_040917 [Zingiber officinale]
MEFLILRFFFFLLWFAGDDAVVWAAQPRAVDVGVILNAGTMAGKRSQTSISMAVDDFYAGHSNYTTRVALHVRDSGGGVVAAASAAVELLKNVEVKSIISSLTSGEAEFVVQLANKTQVPVVCFSATSPALSPAHNRFFLRATISDSAQVPAIAALVRHFGWRQVVPVYEDSNYGAGVLPYLVDALRDGADARVPYRSIVASAASDTELDRELYKLMTMETRVFVVHMVSDLGVRLFRRANELGMMAAGYVWIATYGITNAIDLLGVDDTEAMQGVIGVRPYIRTSEKISDFSARFKRRFRIDHPADEPTDPTFYQLWAYDAAWAVAMAVEKTELINSAFRRPESSGNSYSTDLDRLGVSPSGLALRDAISAGRFQGLAGEFRLLNGELISPAFEFVNVNGSTARSIGYWTPTNGLSKQLTSKTSGPAGLMPVLWPGYGGAVPRGWEIPTNGKKLRIAVPVKHGFDQFVKVETDPTTNRRRVTGYCIDVFEAVVRELPYAVSFEYIPFEDSSQSYDLLVDQVFLRNFDAVVGDTTILARRSEHVEFTMPFTESGVSMIVPIRGSNDKNIWIFLLPLTTELWLGSLCFFIFTGFVVWAIEHRGNTEFAGDLPNQLGTTFYFAFSTLVFSHKENLTSNLTRFAVIIWFFVVLILSSSYTASLTSMLTVQQLQPTVADMSQLNKTKVNIGYQDGSFVQGMLQEMFHVQKLKNYSTPGQYAEALLKGSANGGVDAIFDEIPYLKVFLSEHCTDFTMVGPTYKTDGFGFVFPLGSSLVPDISRAILSITEGEKMGQIEKAWFGDPSNCPSQSNNLNSPSLTFQSFGGLFLITGTVSALALLLFLAKFIYQEWDELRAATRRQSSMWKKMVAVAKLYHNVDQQSLASKREDNGSVGSPYLSTPSDTSFGDRRSDDMAETLQAR